MTFQVKVGDGFPQNICTTCAENLDFIYNFKSKAISCDLELSRNFHQNIHLTYSRVSDDPLNVIGVIIQYMNVLINLLLLH